MNYFLCFNFQLNNLYLKLKKEIKKKICDNFTEVVTNFYPKKTLVSITELEMSKAYINKSSKIAFRTV